MAETEDVKLESETLYGILAMADYFLSLKPKRVPEALQCLLASLKLHPPARIRTQVCCRVGMLLYQYTWNVEDAKEYLNQAVSQLCGSFVKYYNKWCAQIVYTYVHAGMVIL